MCPVCRARFRGANECSRCGADLTRVMTLAASAWRLRQDARRALAAGELARTHDLAARAQQICYTAAGKRLEALSAWLGGQAARR
jgi:predicted amidophosphoribosyltransferase